MTVELAEASANEHLAIEWKKVHFWCRYRPDTVMRSTPRLCESDISSSRLLPFQALFPAFVMCETWPCGPGEARGRLVGLVAPLFPSARAPRRSRAHESEKTGVVAQWGAKLPEVGRGLLAPSVGPQAALADCYAQEEDEEY